MPKRTKNTTSCCAMPVIKNDGKIYSCADTSCSIKRVTKKGEPYKTIAQRVKGIFKK